MAIVTALFEEQGHIYRHPETKQVVPSVTQILSACGLVSYNGVKQSVLDYKSQIGTEAHEACSLVAKRIAFDADERVMPYVDGFRAFCDTKQWTPVVVQPEPRIGELNGSLIGFQPDQIGMLVKDETVLEIKCTSDVYPSYGIQLAFYDLLLGEIRRKRVVVQLFPDGKYRLHEYSDRKDYEVAQCCLALSVWKRNKGIETTAVY